MKQIVKRHLRGLSCALWVLTVLSSAALLFTRTLPALLAFLVLMTCLLFLNLALLRQRRGEDK